MGGCLYREAAVDFGREGLPGRERNVEKEVAYRKTGKRSVPKGAHITGGANLFERRRI